MSEPLLSILVCSLERRRSKLERLTRLLAPQLTGEVELLVEADAGQLATGAKRNVLVRRARGDYVVFIDDDDLVSDDYASKILAACKQERPDCVSIEGVILCRKLGTRTFLHGVEHGSWRQDGKTYLRTPNHLNPVRRELALKTSFPEVSFGEDQNYSQRLLPLLRSQKNTSGPIYYYLSDDWARELPSRLRILLKYPTRGRPRLFWRRLDELRDHLSGRQPVKLIISIDDDDETMKDDGGAVAERAAACSFPVELRKGRSASKVEACNRDLEWCDFDVIVVVSDDMVPRAKDFDEIVANDFVRHFPRLDGAIMYDDGYQPAGKPDKIMTLPVLGKRLYDEWGYVYHPSYTSVFCDNEQTERTRSANKLRHVRRILFEHDWVGKNADDLCRRNQSFFKHDREIYLARKAAGWPP